MQPPIAQQPAGMAAYDELVARSPQGSVFTTSWWLDAVAPGSWKPHVLTDRGRAIAAWPAVVRRSRLGTVLAGAPLTPYMGPLFETRESLHKQRSQVAECLPALVGELGDYASLTARCHPDFDYWAPLAWQGFSQTTQYTWRLPNLHDTDAVFGALRENIRRNVRKARKLGVTVSEGSIEDFLPLRDKTFERQGMRALVDDTIVRRVSAAAHEHDACAVLVARDEQGRAHSAGVFVWDARAMYYLMGGNDADLRSSGAASLVMWHAICMAAQRGLAFDFEGSMLQSVERFFRAFGGEPVPVSVVSHTPSRRFSVAVTARRALRRATRR